MATGKAQMSGGLAITSGVLALVILVIAILGGLSWYTVVIAFSAFAMLVLIWRGAKKQDREYQERMERLEERLGKE
ncbi:hypothetical protein [Kocuria rosea]|uniref:hypothetical protein n=1 Tax=Kocuria rosea TaxID=1275 RepID=UPI000F6E7749|nr:hypothetical protein [Kocuria rosea]MEB2528521.1 hypothetical protein [Kocuria rosea]MEB2619387.1 hypothetical protein [Kocuria rosea]QCY31746.1 hypothetical protein EQG70_01775 [Kocuria rosea]TQN39170.1 hypothetical protein FHX38_1008 [Kocuria rosea]VEI51809.1 Uncharacterised protein [Kocuria rosea]